jgi:hypothetical protein
MPDFDATEGYAKANESASDAREQGDGGCHESEPLSAGGIPLSIDAWGAMSRRVARGVYARNGALRFLPWCSRRAVRWCDLRVDDLGD